MSDKNKKETQIVTINDKEYSVDDLSEKQIALVNHVADLDRKIQTSIFNVEQLKGGREYFMKELEKELEEGEKK
jgi:hypothetical protein